MYRMVQQLDQQNKASHRYRINLVLFIILAILLMFWFHKHLQRYVTETIFIGGTLTFWGAWKLIQSWVKWGLEQSKIPLAQRILDRPAATEYLVLGMFLWGIIYLTTSSVYLVYEGASSKNAEFTVKITHKNRPYMEDLKITPYKRSMGKPFFFRTQPIDLKFEIIKPWGFEPTEKRFNPWTNIQVKVPANFKRKPFRVMSLIPGAKLYNKLPKTSDNPTVKYYLQVEHKGNKYKIDDIRRQAIYVGAQNSDIELLVAQQGEKKLQLTLDKYLADKGFPKERRSDIINACKFEPRVQSTAEFKTGDQIEVQVGNDKNSELLLKKSIKLSSNQFITYVFLESTNAQP